MITSGLVEDSKDKK